jgi:uncharacterized protein YndB with AHSA1/START domain
VQSTVTKTVNAPIERVWTVLADHEGMSSWAPGLRASLTTDGTPERNGVGAVRRLDAPGPMPAIVEEITGFEPQRRLAYRALAGVPLKNYAGEVVLTAQGSGTRIDYTVSADQRLPVVEQVLVRLIATGLLNALGRAVRTSG